MRLVSTTLSQPTQRTWWLALRHLGMQRSLMPEWHAGDQGKAHEQEDLFEAFFRRYEPRITGYLWRMVNDEGCARDLCQETFLRAWQHFAEVEASHQPTAWLFRVATNLALNEIRHRASRIASAISIDANTDPASSDPALRFVERDFVQQILAELPPKQRALLILREVHDVPFADVSRLLGMSPNAAKIALCRARVQFRERYLRKGGR
jgi:RNA polymerase sigma-70 factor (ECF subfamily)